MPTRLPNSVHEAWGEQAAEDFSQWIEEYVQTETVPRDEYQEVLSRLDVIDERFKRIDERFEEVDRRFEEVDKRFEQVNGQFENVDEQFEKIDERFKELADRLVHMEERFDQRLDEQSHQFNQRIDEQTAQFNDRLDRLHEQTRVMMRWTVGTIALFGTIVTVLLAIAEFAG